MTAAEARKLVAMLVGAFGKNDITDETVAVYADRLQELDRDAAHRAVLKLVDSSKFFPRIAEIRELALADDVDERIPSFSQCVRELKGWVSRQRWLPGQPHELTRAACEPIGGIAAWRDSPDENYDPRGYQHTMRRMREAYDDARSALRHRAITATDDERDALLGPKRERKPSLPPPGHDESASRAAFAERTRQAEAELRRREQDRQAELDAPRTGPLRLGGRR